MDSNDRIDYMGFSQHYMLNNNFKELTRVGNTLRVVRAIKRLVPPRKVGRRNSGPPYGYCNALTISDNRLTITHNLIMHLTTVQVVT